jgi:hypothetical protein
MVKWHAEMEFSGGGTAGSNARRERQEQLGWSEVRRRCPFIGWEGGGDGQEGRAVVVIGTFNGNVT